MSIAPELGRQVKEVLRKAIEPVNGDAVFVERWKTVTDAQGKVQWQVWGPPLIDTFSLPGRCQRRLRHPIIQEGGKFSCVIFQVGFFLRSVGASVLPAHAVFAAAILKTKLAKLDAAAARFHSTNAGFEFKQRADERFPIRK